MKKCVGCRDVLVQFTMIASQGLHSTVAQYARELTGPNTSQSAESFELARLCIELLCFSGRFSAGFDFMPRCCASSRCAWEVVTYSSRDFEWMY